MSSDDGIGRVPLLGVDTEHESLVSPIDRRSDYYRQSAFLAKKEKPQPVRQPLLTIPNILTFLRLILVPVLAALWYQPKESAKLACAIVFTAASFTDWLDGYLARKLKIATVFGAFLDPVADKVMVATASILLTTSPPEPLSQAAIAMPVCVIICREITMSALREWAAASGGGAHKAVKVNSLGKWKTACQMLSMTLLLFGRCPQLLIRKFGHWFPGTAEEVLATSVLYSFYMLWAAAGLAAWSLAIYMSNVWTHFIYPHQPQRQKSL